MMTTAAERGMCVFGNIPFQEGFVITKALTKYAVSSGLVTIGADTSIIIKSIQREDPAVTINAG